MMGVKVDSLHLLELVTRWVLFQVPYRLRFRRQVPSVQSLILESPSCCEDFVECRCNSFGGEAHKSLSSYLFKVFLELGSCWLRVASRPTGVSIYPAFPFIWVWDVECAWQLIILVIYFQ